MHSNPLLHSLTVLSSTVDLFNTSKVTGLPTNRPAARTAGTRVVRVAGYEILPTLWAVSNYLGNKHFRGQHGCVGVCVCVYVRVCVHVCCGAAVALIPPPCPPHPTPRLPPLQRPHLLPPAGHADSGRVLC
jgi:hypothetical protein